jgi:hypothetical protein
LTLQFFGKKNVIFVKFYFPKKNEKFHHYNISFSGYCSACGVPKGRF